MLQLRTPAVKAAAGTISRHQWLAPIGLFVLALGLLFFRLDSVGLINICESFYPASVREMIEANSYVVPQLNYQVYFSKPIMTFWLMAASYHIFGINNFGGRFAQAALTLVLVMCVFLVARKLKGNLAGFLSGAFLASSPFLLIYTRASSIDAFFTVFLGLSLCALLNVVSAESKRGWPWIYICLGLAVLTKGPAAIVLFVGGLALSLLILRPGTDKLKSLANQLNPIAGLLLFSAIVLPWWIAVGVATNGLFPEVFLFYENMNRYLGQVVQRTTYWWRYLAVISIGLLPWSLYLPAVFFDTLKNKEKTGNLLDPRIICFGFAATVIIFFSFSSTQLETYVLPACAPLALAAGLSLAGWCKGFNSFGSRWIARISLALRFVGLVGLIAAVAAPWFFKSLTPWLAFGIPIAGLTLALGFNYQYKLIKAQRLEKGLTVTAITMCLFSTLLVPMCIEQWYNDTQKELHDLCGHLKGTKDQVALYMHYLPAVMYYTQGPVDHFFNAGQIAAKKSSQKLYVLALNKEAKDLSANPKLTVRRITEGPRWGLYYIQNGTLTKGETLEKIFQRMSIVDMATLDNTKCGVLTDYYYGGTLNLPARFHNALPNL